MSAELAAVHAGTNTWVTDGHHCFGSNLCRFTGPPSALVTCAFSACECPPPNSLACE